MMLFWQYSLPFIVNLSGSLTFFALLSDTPISLAVPVTNGTTFAATAVVGMLLGEETRVGPALIGTAFIVLCVSLNWRVKNKVRNGGRERELRLEIVGKESGEGSIPSWWRWRRLCGNDDIGGGGGERSGYSILQLEIVSKIKVGFKVFGCR
ncbi:hypothetical protein ACFE04_006986 [Oxalis oulophora]